ncbi:hypothetical protein GCM10010519_01150 [Streptomyces lactacystinicus]
MGIAQKGDIRALSARSDALPSTPPRARSISGWKHFKRQEPLSAGRIPRRHPWRSTKRLLPLTLNSVKHSQGSGVKWGGEVDLHWRDFQGGRQTRIGDRIRHYCPRPGGR